MTVVRLSRAGIPVYLPDDRSPEERSPFVTERKKRERERERAQKKNLFLVTSNKFHVEHFPEVDVFVYADDPSVIAPSYCGHDKSN